ncbi:hypothetical protein H4R35_007274 [Dimargaris xerosporica]|nr:hypothetical protein H4R35_007274 [Dimargaris xerosporica]
MAVLARGTLGLMALVCLARPSGAEPTTDSSQTIAQNLVALDSALAFGELLAQPRFDDFRDRLNRTGEQFTMFVPQGNALAETTKGVSGDDAQAIVAYHVLSQALRVKDISAYQLNATTLTDAHYVQLPKDKGQMVKLIQRNAEVTLVGGKPNHRVQVVTADLACSNGVIHIVDEPLHVPAKLGQAVKDIPDLSSVAALLSATDNVLTELESQRGVTLYLPNNAALAGIDTSALSPTELKETLQFHAVAGDPAYSPTIHSTQQVQTLQGGSIIVNRTQDDTVFVNNAHVVNPDILIANGVVHIIDKLLNTSSAVRGPDSSSPAARALPDGASWHAARAIAGLSLLFAQWWLL